MKGIIETIKKSCAKLQAGCKQTVSAAVPVLGRFFRRRTVRTTKSTRRDQAGNTAGNAGRMLLVNPVKSVGMKLFLIFFVSILVFVIAVGSISYSISRSVVQEKVSEASLQATIQAGQKLDFLLSSIENVSLQLMLDKDLQAQLNDLSAIDQSSYDYLDASRKISDRLNVYANSDKNIKGVYLFKTDGTFINVGGASMGGTASGSSFADKEWFKKILGGAGKAVWLESKPKGYSETLPTPAFAIGRALRDTSSSKINGIVLLEVTTDVLMNQLSQISLGTGSSIQIVTADNSYVITAKPEEIGRKSAFPLSSEQLKRDYGSSVTSGNEIVYYKSPVSSWYLLGAIPVNALTESAKRIADITIIMSLLAMVAAIVIGYFVARMIRRPLNILRELMERGAQGHLSGRAAFKTKDEMGELGNSFDRMMEEITSLVEMTRRSAVQVLETAAELTHASRTTSGSAKEIAVATGEISAGATGLAADAERVSELTQQIGERMTNVIDANLQMGRSAGSVQSSSELGTKYMSELIDKTNHTETMIRSMVEKVDKLKESTRSIRKILDLLNNMTKQTNILSLNAAIEAARAGTAGRGFMVVADEIRKLADQSRQSIGVVGEITDTIQREIDETVQTLFSANPIFAQQIAAVKEADLIFRQVRTNMGGFITQLSHVSDSISELDNSQGILSDAMTNVSAVAQQSLATSDQVASLSQEQLRISDGLVILVEKLENLSNSLRDSLSRFEL